MHETLTKNPQKYIVSSCGGSQQVKEWSKFMLLLLFLLLLLRIMEK